TLSHLVFSASHFAQLPHLQGADQHALAHAERTTAIALRDVDQRGSSNLFSDRKIDCCWHVGPHRVMRLPLCVQHGRERVGQSLGGGVAEQNARRRIRGETV